MSEPDSTAEKTEPPSPFKLAEARKKGQVVKSQDISAFVVLFISMIYALMMGLETAYLLFERSKLWFQRIPTLLSDPTAWQSITQLLAYDFLRVTGLLFFFLILAGILGHWGQTGPMFSAYPLKPNFKKMHPKQGIKKIISKRVLFDGVKTIVKMMLLFFLAYVGVLHFISQVPAQVFSPAQGVSWFAQEGSLLGILMLVGLLFAAVIDRMISRWHFMQEMRMSKKEVKDEYKRREGDPLIKSKRKEIEKQLREKTQGLSDVKQADVIITNPTHVAVALCYDSNTMAAPKLLCKGKGELAQRIRNEAYRHQITVVSQPPLARLIYKKTTVGHWIPEEAFLATAKILHQVYEGQKDEFHKN